MIKHRSKASWLCRTAVALLICFGGVTSAWAQADAPPAQAEPESLAEPTAPRGAPDPEFTGEPEVIEESETGFEEVPDADPSALDDFRPHLDPYGHWEEHPVYGTVWVPHKETVGTRFAPYVSRGRWSLTHDDQWVWVSDYPFGWVTFHYGRWVWADSYGWSWIPGRRYAHAWVHFRVSNSPYIGWAPMSPRYVWRNGVAVWLGSVPPSPYVFVQTDHAFYPSLHSYVIYQHYRVRPLMRRSYAYIPHGVRRVHHRHPRYYSPPLRYVPARAHPRGRVKAHPEALRLRRLDARRHGVTSERRASHRTIAQPRRLQSERSSVRSERSSVRPSPSRSLRSAPRATGSRLSARESRSSRLEGAKRLQPRAERSTTARPKAARPKAERSKRLRRSNDRAPRARPSPPRQQFRSRSRSTGSGRVRAAPRRAR